MSETSLVDEKKFHKLDPAKKPLYIAVISLIVLVAVPALSYLYYQSALDRPAQCTQEKTFVIEKGEGASSIAARLYQEGLINSKALFNIYVIMNNLQSKLQAGTYTIPAGCSVKKLSELFQQGRDDTSIVFLEGWRTEEIAEAASNKFTGVGYESFVEQAKPYEGKLFPDTYQFNIDVNEQGIIDVMLRNFEEKTADILTDSAVSKVGFSKEQVLTLASVVEREVTGETDRKIVAGIFMKRLKEGMRLDADATTQYAVASKNRDSWWPKNLTARDLESDSPYNTRKNPGLPPTPICNPSLEAIQAVLNPTDTKYYYYLTDPEGVIHYAITPEEHNRNISSFLQN